MSQSRRQRAAILRWLIHGRSLSKSTASEWGAGDRMRSAQRCQGQHLRHGHESVSDSARRDGSPPQFHPEDSDSC
eukprot:3022562-Pyramimonas_sp.AAC.1